MVPDNLSGLVIDGPKKCFACDAVVGAGPPVGSVVRLEEVNAVAILRADDEQAGLPGQSWSGRKLVAPVSLGATSTPSFDGIFGRIGR